MCKYDLQFKEVPTIKELYASFRALFRSGTKYLMIENGKSVVCGYITYKKIEKCRYRIGITLNKKFWHRGYAHDAINVTLDHIFNDLKGKEVYLKVMIENENAIRCYRKCGFVGLDKTKVDINEAKQKYIDIKNENKDIIIMTIDREIFSSRDSG